MTVRQVAISFLLVLMPSLVSAQTPAAAARRARSADLNQVFSHEQQVWNALKANDIAAFNKLVDGPFTYLDANGFVAWRPEESEANLKGCVVNGFTTEEAQVQRPTDDMAILSYKINLDQVCGEQRVPTPQYVLSVWQRKGSAWRLIAHSETPAAARAQ